MVKYGAGNESLITALADQFVEEKAQIIPEDLARLEKEVVLALRNRRARAPEGSGAAPEPAPHVSVAATSATSAAAEVSLAPPPPGSEWIVIAAWQELQNEAKATEEKRLARQKKIDFKNALDAHVADSRRFASDVIARKDAEYQANMLKDVAKYHEEEHQKKLRLHQRGQEQLQIQKRQIVDAKQRAETLKIEQSKLEQDMLAEAQAKIQAETEKQARIRAFAREQQAIVDQDNEANELIKQAQAKRDADDTIRLQQEYAAKLDKDDWVRTNAHAERMKKMEAAFQKSETDGAGKAAREETIKIERLLLKEQAEAEKQAIQKEAAKALAKKQRLQKMMTENDKLVESKLKAKENVRVTDAEFARKALEDVERFKREEMAKKEAAHARHLGYRGVLDQQMKNKPTQADPTSAAFLGREAAINRSLYDNAVHNPQVLKKLNSPDRPKQSGPRIATHK